MKNKTNNQIINAYMNEHPLNQLFVMEALSHYANSVTTNKDTLIEQMHDGFIDGNAWVSSAESWVLKQQALNPNNKILNYD